MGIEEGWSGVDGDGMGLDRAVESSGMCSGSANLSSHVHVCQQCIVRGWG